MVEIADYAFPRSVVQVALNELGKPLLPTLKPVPLISFRLRQSKIQQPFAAKFELCTGYAILPNSGRYSMPEVQTYGITTTSGAHERQEVLIPKVLRKGGY
jgi:hypothetical protein